MHVPVEQGHRIIAEPQAFRLTQWCCPLATPQEEGSQGEPGEIVSGVVSMRGGEDGEEDEDDKVEDVRVGRA